MCGRPLILNCLKIRVTYCLKISTFRYHLLRVCMQGRWAPYHGADDPGDVDGVMAAGDISGWVFLVTGASVQDGEANVQDVLFKLSPERLRLKAGASTIFQTLP